LNKELDGGKVLDKAWTRTHPSSPDVNFLRLEQSGQRLFLDAVKRLRTHEWSPVEFHSQLKSPGTPAKSFFTKATNLQMLLFAVRVLLPTAICGIFHRRKRALWTVAITPLPTSGEWGKTDYSRAEWLRPSSNFFVADPFVWLSGNDVFIFVEEYDYSQRKGRVAVTRWSPTEGFGPLETALEETIHLSFPFLFEFEGQVLMMPEQSERHELWCYSTSNFPHNWKKHRLIEAGLQCTDSVLLWHQDKWWLFYSKVVGEAAEDNLYASYSSSPFGPWIPHPCHPLKTGLRGSRMAGAFWRDPTGALIRPSQDCSQIYGGSLVFHEILELTPTSFRESEINTLNASAFPKPWRDRCHTWNTAGPWVVVDACNNNSKQ
jgi:hypothetical protein